MAVWILLALVAQFINAMVSIVDRYIIASGKVGKPIVVTFYVSLLSSLGILAFAFGWINVPLEGVVLPTLLNVGWPNMSILGTSFFAGLTFILGLYFLFSSFVFSEASDVVPVVSSVSAISSLLFSFYLLNTSVSGNFLWGFLFLVIGTALISHFRMTKKVVMMSIFAGFLFGLHLVLIKMLFNETNFDNAFFWSRFFITILSLGLLLSPEFSRKKNKTTKTNVKKGSVILVVSNKALAGFASILILKAVELGDVSIVQALAGLQFVFLILFTIFFGKKAPKCIGENCQTTDIVQKVISISIIVTGFSLLFI